MDIKGYQRIKKIDIKKWLLRGNAVIYAFILIVFVAAVIFMFNTVGSMFNTTEEKPSEAPTENTTYIADNQSYKISVNKAENFITIYKIDADGKFNTAYKTFRCAVNQNVETGETKINEKYVWRRLADSVYGHYTSGLANSAYIHSVPYASQSNADLIASAYNKLGKSAGIGSIYLAAADVKWIYENCGVNTTVDIYEKAGESPSIALGEFTQIAADSKYDPTDNVRASEDGKVDTKIDYMTGVDNCTIRLGESFDRWKGIYAVDMSGKDITSSITITGDLNLSTPGQYVLIYHLEDDYGTKLAYWRYITVTDGTDAETTQSQETTTAVEKTTEAEAQTTMSAQETTTTVRTQEVTTTTVVKTTAAATTATTTTPQTTATQTQTTAAN